MHATFHMLNNLDNFILDGHIFVCKSVVIIDLLSLY